MVEPRVIVSRIGRIEINQPGTFGKLKDTILIEKLAIIRVEDLVSLGKHRLSNGLGDRGAVLQQRLPDVRQAALGHGLQLAILGEMAGLGEVAGARSGNGGRVQQGTQVVGLFELTPGVPFIDSVDSRPDRIKLQRLVKAKVYI